MSETSDNHGGVSEWERSPTGLDLNPRPPRAVRVSKRAAGAVLTLAAVVLALFAYGGYQRQQRQIAALAHGDSRKNVAPALAAGADIAKDVPSGNLPTTGINAASPAPGILHRVGELQPSTGSAVQQISSDRVIVRQSPHLAQPIGPAQIRSVREPTPEERRLAAAYEREQQAIAAPTISRDTFGAARSSGTIEPARSLSDQNQLASLLAALGKVNPGSSSAAPGRREGADTPGYEDQNMQARKREFLLRAGADQTAGYLKSTRNAPLSLYEIKAGWEIPAVMEQALNSDLPGEVKALVTSNVYDSATGEFLLIPQGARLVGIYNSQIGYGQEGVQVIWNRAIYPDGSTLDLGGMIGQDSSGASGFHGKVNRHYKRLIGFAVLTSLFTAASDLAQSRNRSFLTYPSRGEIVGSSAGREASELGAQVTRRNLNVQPTLKIPVGYKFNVRVNRDILFEAPYEPLW